MTERISSDSLRVKLRGSVVARTISGKPQRELTTCADPIRAYGQATPPQQADQRFVGSGVVATRLSRRANGLFTEHQFEQRFAVAKIRNHHVRSDAQQTLSLPLVHAARAIVRLVARDGHGQPPDLLRV